jgi:SPP1 family predicted phage head-tail adaptor
MKMNDRVTLLKRAAGRDAAGQPLPDSWADTATVWANVRFQTGAEVLRANAETSIVRVSIRIRARADVDGAWRVRFKGIEYDVKSALPDSDDRQFMFLVCESIK